MSRAQLTSTVEQNTGGAVSPYVAGKNKIINGDFGIWQRGTSFSNPSGAYTADRYQFAYAGSPTFTITQQALTPGSISGYEAPYCMQHACTVSGSSITDMYNKIENVQNFAGQTATISFWAKAVSGTPVLSALITQNFGSGGSASVDTSGASFTLTSSWVRYSATIAVPSITGKTIGAGSYLLTNIRFTHSVATFQIWGLQFETGSVATPFTTATGTLSGELQACQRYYNRFTTTASYGFFGLGTATSTTGMGNTFYLPQMRVAPTSMDYANVQYTADNATTIVPSSFTLSSGTGSGNTSNTVAFVFGAVIGATAFRPYFLIANNNANAYIGFSAEL